MIIIYLYNIFCLVSILPQNVEHTSVTAAVTREHHLSGKCCQQSHIIHIHSTCIVQHLQNLVCYNRYHQQLLPEPLLHPLLVVSVFVKVL